MKYFVCSLLSYLYTELRETKFKVEQFVTAQISNLNLFTSMVMRAKRGMEQVEQSGKYIEIY